TTLVDYIPRLPKIQLNSFQEILGLTSLVFAISWCVVSSIIVWIRTGSFFADDPECPTFLKLVQKHSPPFWREFACWAFRLQIALVVLFLISLLVWHERPNG